MEVRPIDNLSFEAAMQELEQIVRQLEEGRVPLQEAVAAYTRGSALKAHCEGLLKQARTTVEQIITQDDGTIEAGSSPLQAYVDSDDA